MTLYQMDPPVCSVCGIEDFLSMGTPGCARALGAPDGLQPRAAAFLGARTSRPPGAEASKKALANCATAARSQIRNET